MGDGVRGIMHDATCPRANVQREHADERGRGGEHAREFAMNVPHYPSYKQVSNEARAAKPTRARLSSRRYAATAS